MNDYLSPVFDTNNINAISSLGLAHIGDGVYELMVRTWLCEKGMLTSARMHKETVSKVSAAAQSRACDSIIDMLDEEERNVYLRGRNTSPKNVPKSVDRSVYQKATALESLFGYLYLKGRNDRLNELFAKILQENS